MSGDPFEHAQPTNQSQQPSPLRLDVISARELQAKEMPPLVFLVTGILPQGLAVVAAPSKYGKSWMALDLCLSVASGRPFMGFRTQKRETLYLALEDGLRRLKSRLETLLGVDAAPDGFFMATAAQTIDTGLQQQIAEHLKDHPDTGLIVIDVLARVRSTNTRRKTDAYRLDYDDMTALKRIADERNICIMLVHHTRKIRDDSDIFNAINGTTGIMGAADTIWMLNRERREDERTTLNIIGRDVEQQSIIITLDNDTHRWRRIGTVEEEAARMEYQQFEADSAVRTIRALLRENPSGFTISASEFLEEMARKVGDYGNHTSPTEIGRYFAKTAGQLLRYDGIVYGSRRKSRNTSHTFKPKAETFTLTDDREGGKT